MTVYECIFLGMVFVGVTAAVFFFIDLLADGMNR